MVRCVYLGQNFELRKNDPLINGIKSFQKQTRQVLETCRVCFLYQINIKFISVD